MIEGQGDSGPAEMQHIFVKICGITTLEDALAALEAGADALGFNFWPGSPRCIPPAAAAGIVLELKRAAAGAGRQPLLVGVFVDAPAADIEATLRSVRLGLAQVHGAAPPLAVPWWQALPAGPDLESRARAAQNAGAEAVLVDTPSGAWRGGTGRVFDWSLVRGLPAPVVLAGGLGLDNVAQAILEARPWGIDACSRLESAPGRKDPALVRAFIHAVREAELQE